MKNCLKSSLALAVLVLAATGVCNAAVPEIDPQTGMGGLAVISGAFLILRNRRKR